MVLLLLLQLLLLPLLLGTTRVPKVYHEAQLGPRGTAGLEELAEANTAGSEELEWSNKLPSALCVLEREASAVQEGRHAGV